MTTVLPKTSLPDPIPLGICFNMSGDEHSSSDRSMEVSCGLMDAHGLLVLVLTMMSTLFKLTYICNESRGEKITADCEETNKVL